MYCSRCKCYIPSGLNLARCPSCDVDLTGEAPPVERFNENKVEPPPLPSESKEQGQKKDNRKIRVKYLWYLLFFCISSIYFAHDNYKSHYALSFVIGASVSYALANIGVLLYAFRLSNKALSWFWKPISILFVVHLMIEGTIDNVLEKASLGMSILVWALGVLLFYPALKANFSLAFPRSPEKPPRAHVLSITFFSISFVAIILSFVSWFAGGSVMGLWLMMFLTCALRLLIFRKKGKRYIAFSVLAGAIIYLALFFSCRPYLCLEQAMAPAIEPKDKAFVSHLLRIPKRGDIIVFITEKMPNREIISRVIGLPGETVRIGDGKAWINGTPLTVSPFDKNNYFEGTVFAKKGEEVTVPSRQYFVLGDNNAMSADSREIGCVSSQNIKGTVVKVIKPVFKFDVINYLTTRFGPQKKTPAETALYDFKYYYKKPEPRKIPEALRQYLSSPEFINTDLKDNSHAFQMAYLFGRVARMSPQVLPEYQQIFEGANHKQRIFLAVVLQVGGNEATLTFLQKCKEDPKFKDEKEWIGQTISKGIPSRSTRLQKPIEDASDLDMRWSEFVLTGDAGPVKQILAVLAWEDVLRGKILSYLKSPNKDAKIMDILRQHYNIYVSNEEILSREDLDIKIGMDLMERDGKEAFQAIKGPLAITNPQLIRLSVKSAAFWAAGSNALQHEKVYETVKDAINKVSGSQKIELLKIASQTARASGANSGYLKYLEDLIALNPTDVEALGALFYFYVGEDDPVRARNTLKRISSVDPQKAKSLQQEMFFCDLTSLKVPTDAVGVAPSQYVPVMQKAKEQLKAYESHSRLIVRESSGPGKPESIDWRFKHVLPDRYDVEQYMKGAADKWITIGDENYAFFGFWIKEPAGSDAANRHLTNESVSILKYYKMIEGINPAAVKTFASNLGPIVWMTYNRLNPTDFLAPKGTNRELELFINEAGLIVKAVFFQKGTVDGKLTDQNDTQVFSYDPDIQILPPKALIDRKPDAVKEETLK